MKNFLVIFLSFFCLAAIAQNNTVNRPRQGSAQNSSVNRPQKHSTLNNGSGKKSRRMTETQRKDIINNLINNMVYVQGGTFMMGYEDPSITSSIFAPVHQVTLSDFYIGKYEVTQQEWKAVMGDNPSHYKGDLKPVEDVSWDDCQRFIDKLNRITNRHFRLPTEAEWEFAARGGNRSHGYKYSGGNNLYEVGWYIDNSGHTTHKVGSKKCNELGLYDMSGNVDEWCYDYFYDYDSSPQTNPVVTSPERSYEYERVQRGGAATNFYHEVWNRSRASSDFRNKGYGNFGFRLAM